MGMYGTIVVYPVGGRAPAPDRLESVARQTLRAFERVGLLLEGTSETVIADREITSVTAFLEDDPPAGLTWVHLGVHPSDFRPALSDLVFTMSEREWSLNPNSGSELLALPFLDVTLLSTAIEPTEPSECTVVCRSWALIEFSYEDIRYHEEVHCIRQEGHPLFQELGKVLNAELEWTVYVH